MAKEDSKDKKILEAIHIELHGLRLVPNYKASNFEVKINGMISEHFKSICDECNKRTTPEIKNQAKKTSFMDKLLGGD